MNKSILIHKFNKNSMEEIHISRTNFNGKDLVDLRLYYEDDNGEFKPSKKGITVTLECAEHLITGIKKLEKEILQLLDGHPRLMRRRMPEHLRDTEALACRLTGGAQLRAGDAAPPHQE